jgi:hypothetical protein
VPDVLGFTQLLSKESEQGQPDLPCLQASRVSGLVMKNFAQPAFSPRIQADPSMIGVSFAEDVLLGVEKV